MGGVSRRLHDEFGDLGGTPARRARSRSMRVGSDDPEGGGSSARSGWIRCSRGGERGGDRSCLPSLLCLEPSALSARTNEIGQLQTGSYESWVIGRWIKTAKSTGCPNSWMFAFAILSSPPGKRLLDFNSIKSKYPRPVDHGANGAIVAQISHRPCD